MGASKTDREVAVSALLEDLADRRHLGRVRLEIASLQRVVRRLVVDVGIVLSTNLVSLIRVQHGGVPKKFPELNDKVEKLLPDFYAASLLKG